MKKRWTAEDTKMLLERGYVPHRSFRSNQRMRAKYNLRQLRPPRPRWTAEQRAQLRQLHAQGKCAREIHQSGLFPQSQMGIQKQLCRMGLAKKNKIVRFPQSLREKFKAFLLANWQGRTPEDLLALWNQTAPQHATNIQQVIAYLVLLKIKIPYGEVQRIKASRRREQKIQQQPHPSSSALLDKIRSNRAQVMRARIDRGRDIWSGLKMPAEELNASLGDPADDAAEHD